MKGKEHQHGLISVKTPGTEQNVLSDLVGMGLELTGLRC